MNYGMYLEVDVCNVLSQGNPCLPVDDLHSNGSIALGLEDIVDQVLWRKIHIAAPVRIVFT